MASEENVLYVKINTEDIQTSDLFKELVRNIVREEMEQSLLKELRKQGILRRSGPSQFKVRNTTEETPC